ncbi:hypothetical protein BDV93DRAFT_259687 [Ceratobasidium sp. AG-I]|nr:hypothetical protein BDV93DRAFT_259687 [Ceratobasidium sp. AG-I]
MIYGSTRLTQLRVPQHVRSRPCQWAIPSTLPTSSARPPISNCAAITPAAPMATNANSNASNSIPLTETSLIPLSPKPLSFPSCSAPVQFQQSVLVGLVHSQKQPVVAPFITLAAHPACFGQLPYRETGRLYGVSEECRRFL